MSAMAETVALGSGTSDIAELLSLAMRGNHLVREARRRAGLTQAQLAERAGTTQSAVARTERGVTTPSLDQLSRLVQAAGLDIEVRLVPFDDHDVSIARRNRTLGIDDRVRNMKRAERFARAARRARLGR
jgi:transcriptional regulator with XRE-family HTH domain